jgi:thioredoxin 1
MKRFVFSIFILLLTQQLFSQEPDLIESLNERSFKKKIFDYQNETKWKYKGKLPAIVNFYGESCNPCDSVNKIMLEIATNYNGKVLMYKLNADENPIVTTAFVPDSLPMLFFVPVKGKPKQVTGLKSKTYYYSLLTDFLNVEIK